MTKQKLTQKQRNFALDVFRDVTPSEAYLIHYKCKPSASYSLASRLLTNAKIQSYLEELRNKAEEASIASVVERKQILSQILRTKPEDIMELSEDGKTLTIKREALKSPAISYIKTDQVTIGEEKFDVTITKLSLTDKIRAAGELNKMEKIYTENTSININQNVEANIAVFDTREVAKAIIEAIGLGINPELLEGNEESEDTTILPSQTDI